MSFQNLPWSFPGRDRDSIWIVQLWEDGLINWYFNLKSEPTLHSNGRKCSYINEDFSFFLPFKLDIVKYRLLWKVHLEIGCAETWLYVSIEIIKIYV